MHPNSNAYRRYVALKNICSNIVAMDTDSYLSIPFFGGLQYHYSLGPGVLRLNQDVKKMFRQQQFDILLVDNKPYLYAATLQKIKQLQPRCKIANLLTDDPFGLYAKSWGLSRKTASLYDIHFVQRTVNVAEFKQVGASRVALCYRSFDPTYNRPIVLNDADKKIYETEVGFVGTYENYRASFIAFLIENAIPVSVTGDGWEGKPYWNIIQPYYKGPSVYGEKYIKTINGMQIALHFLRHANRDEQDSRTFEIPACKVFMIAESSDLQKKIFAENEEVVFFETKEQLLEKLLFFRQHSPERARIAANAYERCLKSGYSHQARMEKVLETILKIPA